MGHLARLSAGVIVLAAVAAAQRSWVVDANNGPGTDFLDLPPAIAAVAAGDTLLVRPAVYTSSTIAKALNVVTDRTTPERPTLNTLTIEGVADAVVVKGLSVVYTLTVRDCPGRVHLQNLIGPISHNSLFFGTYVERCRLVSIDGSTFAGMRCQDSTLNLSNSVIATARGTYLPALEICDSEVRLTLTTVRGPDALCGFGSVPPGSGISQTRGRLVLAAGSSISGGQIGGCSSFTLPPAIESGGGQILRDPRVFLFPDRIEGSSTVTVRTVPAVVGWINGGTVSWDLAAIPGHLYVLLASESTLDVPTPFGALWVGIGHVVVSGGIIDATGHARGQVSFASVRRGFPLTLQGVTLGQGPLGLTEPSITVLR